jgi:NADH dehydrogenase FAD-containing subunit
VVWAGGLTVNGTAADLAGSSAATDGRLHVDSNLSVADRLDMFAIGDAAAIPTKPGSLDTCPQLAQVATQSERHAVSKILAQVAGHADDSAPPPRQGNYGSCRSSSCDRSIP